MSGLTIGSLFAGIGGLELGLERGIGNGAHTVWQVEQNAYCRAVLAKHWPDATRYEDVRDVGRSNLAPVDVLCGGFPCQDISGAGGKSGLSGARSGLWSEYVRIIRELRPAYVVVENVRALLVRGIGDVLGTLADSGYDAEWSVVGAADVGAPHQRDRLFILAYPHGLRQLQPKRRIANERRRTRDSREAVAHAHRELQGHGHDGAGASLQDRAQAHERLGSAVSDANDWSVEPDVGRVAHGVPARVDRLRALGNAVVPQVAEVVGRLIAERETEQETAA